MMNVTASIFLRLLRPERHALNERLRRSQWLSVEQTQALQQAKLTRLLQHASGHVPFYRRYLAEKGLRPEQMTLDELARLPLTDKTIMSARRDEFIAENVPRTELVPTQTGGSSGTWFHFFADRQSTIMRRALDIRARTWAGWRLGDKQAILWGHREDVRASQGLSSRLRNVLYDRSITLNAYNMDEPTILAYQKRLLAYRPVLILGYTSALAFLARYLAERKLPFPPLKAVLCSAETLTPELERIISDFYACPVYNRYGCREVGGIAQQCERRGGLHIMSEHVLVELLDVEGAPCPPGTLGEVVLTDLDNFGMPFIRYRTGDLAVAAAGLCPCGRGQPLLAGVEGRVSEIIVGKNGKYYSCQSPRLFGADIPGFKQMQIVQETLEEIEVVIAPTPTWSRESERLLTERMQDLLGDIRVRITLVDKIPPAASGKYPFTISKVSPFTRRDRPA
jgi:phenylacetate-CoA ligase